MFKSTFRFMNLMINVKPSFEIPSSDSHPLHHFSTRCSYTSNISQSYSHKLYTTAGAAGTLSGSIVSRPIPTSSTPPPPSSARRSRRTTKGKCKAISTVERMAISQFAPNTFYTDELGRKVSNFMVASESSKPSQSVTLPTSNFSFTQRITGASPDRINLSNGSSSKGQFQFTRSLRSYRRIKHKIVRRNAVKGGLPYVKKNNVTGSQWEMRTIQPSGNGDTTRLQRSKGAISMRTTGRSEGSLTVLNNGEQDFVPSDRRLPGTSNTEVADLNAFSFSPTFLDPELSPISEDIDKFTIRSQSTFASNSNSTTGSAYIPDQENSLSGTESFGSSKASDGHLEEHRLVDEDSLSLDALTSSHSLSVLHYLDKPSNEATHGSLELRTRTAPDLGTILPSLMLTYPTPELARSPVFAPQSPFTINKFVAASAFCASASGGHLAQLTPALSSHGNESGIGIGNACGFSLPRVVTSSPKSQAPTLPRCLHCGFGFDFASPSTFESVPCRMCEKQWMACQLWYHAKDGGRGMSLKEPYVKPAESNASSRAIMGTLGYPVGSPRGLGIADGMQEESGSVSDPGQGSNGSLRCDELGVFNASTSGTEGYSRLSWSRRGRAAWTTTVNRSRPKAVWRKLSNFFTLRYSGQNSEHGVTRDATTTNGNRRRGLDIRPFEDLEDRRAHVTTQDSVLKPMSVTSVADTLTSRIGRPFALVATHKPGSADGVVDAP